MATLNYLLEQHRQVEPLYALEQAGKFKADQAATSVEGRAFLEGQLLKGGEMLGAIWLTAWRAAPPDTYLQAQLIKRQTAAASAP